MVLQLQALFLLLGSQFSIASTSHCSSSLENSQKKMIMQFIYKDPFAYGKDIEVTKVETLSCSLGATQRYLVTYTDIVCYDLNDPNRELIKCYRIKCESPALILNSGIIEFDLAPQKSCEKISKQN